MPTKKHLVFDFIRSPREKLQEVYSGKAPRESLLGYIQLQERGWPISASDDRWTGLFGALRQKLRFRLELPSLRMINTWRTAEIIVITTRISLILALIAKALGKKIVFLDAMCEEVPKRLWRRLPIQLALRLANNCICLSQSQAMHWSKQLNVPIKHFTPIHYGVDPDFSKPAAQVSLDSHKKATLLAVGRDPRRDFNTLLQAVNELDWELILVTQPYLVPEGIRNNPRVQILDGLSYQQLFDVYANATIVVVPIKRNTTYMSGIRATMEAMLLEVPVIASRVPGMEDYFSDAEELLYFEPENTKSLVEAIQKINGNSQFTRTLVKTAKYKVTNLYSVSNYADELETILQSL